MRVMLTVAHGPHAGKSFVFDDHDNFIVGRASYAHFRLPRKDQFFSRVHFMVEVNPPCCRLMDMGSRNGTYVNNRRVKLVDIRDGDLIKGGNTVIRVSIEDDTGAEIPVVGGPPVSTARPTESRKPPSRDLGRKHVLDQDEPAIYGFPAEIDPADSSESPRLADLAGRGADRRKPPVPGQVVMQDTLVIPNYHADPRLSEEQRRLLPHDFESQISHRSQPVPGYLLVDEISRGGLGSVYRAIRLSDQIVVAIKAIKPAATPRPGECEKVVEDFRQLAPLTHPNLVRLLDAGIGERLLFVAMEYVPGVNAAQFAQQFNGPLPVNRAVGIICQLLLPLEYAHSRNVVHRDIKPSNILLTQVAGKGVVKLADYGLARTYSNSRLSGLTMMGDAPDAGVFQPPEIMTDYRNAHPATDQYSAAASLYYLLTRQHVYDFPEEAHGRFSLILQEHPTPIQSRRPDLPDELAAIIHTALSRDPAQRFPSVSAFRTALLPFCSWAG